MRTLLALALSSTLLLTACGSETDDGNAAAEDKESAMTPLTVDGPDAAENLENARTLWEQADLDSYQWTVQRNCYCPPLTANITVSGDDVTSLENVAPGSGAKPKTLDVATMDQLFDFIEEELKDADEVTATYDPETGAVKKVDVDRLKGAADDEMGYVVKEFRAQG